MQACRSCSGHDLQEVLSLGEMPPANALPTASQLDDEEARYPLEVVMCTGCTLLQLTESPPPDELFVDYAYFSSRSTPMVDHARALVNEVMDERRLGPNDLVIEVASNDGYLLRHYRDLGVKVLGIDPAENVVEVAVAAGIPTRVAFFTSSLADELRSEGLTASVVHANNVLAHVPDINDFVAGVARILSDDGVFVVETPYVRDLIEKLEFDTIYHEHVFYYSLHSVMELFARNGLSVVDVKRIGIHGGSLRLRATPIKRAIKVGNSVAMMLRQEKDLGIDDPSFYSDFAHRVDGLLDELRVFLGERRDQGRRIAGYGAAAKGTVLLNALGIGTETIEFVVDETPYKQGRFIPGVRIPIVGPGALLTQMPDDVLIFAWNFADAIIEKEAAYRARGGVFLLPVPTPRVVTG
ncbi:MAG: class I SAM-dependent methyltransferase [Actinobacteria bacterium]|nr:class I SAM-dependent methyltransferase [Actinomycetota bacterium]